MSRFSIRIHGQASARLIERFADVGIVDTIESDDGRRYRLPPGEYSFVGNRTYVQVLELVKKVASGLVPTFSVVVSEATSQVWYGLEEVPRRSLLRDYGWSRVVSHDALQAR